MRLLEYGPDDDAALAADVAINGEISAADSPWERPGTLLRRRSELRHGDDGEPGRHFLVQVDGADVGLVALHASNHDNLELAWLWVGIRPSLRRRGLGRAALELALEACRHAGRPLVLLYGWDTVGCRGLAASAGFAEKSLEVRRVQDLDGSEAERDRFAALRDAAAGHAADYELIRVEGRSPDSLLPELVGVTEAINDAPTDDLEYEDEKHDVDRIRSYEAAQEAAGVRLRRVIARHRGTGELVGHTVVAVDAEQPAWGEQHDTAVLPEHRGHRLGLLLKSEMLLWLHDDEPGLRHVLTENMESNEAMIGVNELLGYRIAGRQVLFQRRL